MSNEAITHEIPTHQIPSLAREVTFFEDRARVVRLATLNLEAGTHTVAVRGVTMLVDDPSLVVRAPDAPDVRVLSSRVRRTVRTVGAAAGGMSADVEALLERERADWQAVCEARLEVGLVGADRDRVDHLEQCLLDSARAVPTGPAERERGIDTAGWSEAFGGIDAAFGASYEVMAEARSVLEQAEREHRRARTLLELARLQKSEYVALVEVQLEVSTPGSVALELTYFTPCALWRPSHLARLTRTPTPMLEIVTQATAWQATGEEWEGVVCRFSTARVARASRAPLIDDDVLVAQAKPDERRHIIEVEARDQTIAVVGAAGARAVAEMPGVDDGGEPLTFVASRPFSIPSDGRPARVEIARSRNDCKVERLVIPEVSAAMHLRATSTWLGQTPLLAGPVMLVREEEFAGRAAVEFVGVGDALELGFGVDSGVRVHRQVAERRKDAKLIGRNTITRTVTLFVSNLGSEPRTFEILERIPVSEIEEVTVRLLDTKLRADRDGMVRIPVELGPRETLTRELRYVVEYDGKVSLQL